MKTILVCKICNSAHSISSHKVNGKKGKFHCKNCSKWNEFDLRAEKTANKTNALVLFDMQFNDTIPDHKLQGQLFGTYVDHLEVNWVDDRMAIFSAENSEKTPPLFISGLPNFNRLKGFVYDIFPNDSDSKIIIEFENSINQSNNLRFSLFIESVSDVSIEGKLYIAVADAWNTFLHGSFKANRITTIHFDENGSFDKALPIFTSNLLSAKVFALSGNILHLQESFSRLFEEEKLSLLTLILEHWPLDGNRNSEVHFKEDHLYCIFQISERKLNETFIFLIANQVIPQKQNWKSIYEIIGHTESEPLFVPILKKKFPDIYSQTTEVVQVPETSLEGYEWMESDEPYLLDGFLRKVGSLDYILQDETLNPLGFTILQEALVRSKVKIVSKLLEKGANPNIRDANGETALFKLCQDNTMRLQNKLILMDELIKNKANVNFQSVNGLTALHWCCVFGEPSLAQKLIKADCNVHIADTCGNTALHESCKFANSAVLALLLESGSKPNEKNSEGKTGRDLAFESLEIAELEGDNDKVERYKRILSLLDVYGG
ncbi:ankyrin repeat domain-containing protein [Leptospira sp. 96542]|nr:ankyrin repeat domain-containing protein [Leptospira sp. 96542]